MPATVSGTYVDPSGVPLWGHVVFRPDPAVSVLESGDGQAGAVRVDLDEYGSFTVGLATAGELANVEGDPVYWVAEYLNGSLLRECWPITLADESPVDLPSLHPGDEGSGVTILPLPGPPGPPGDPGDPGPPGDPGAPGEVQAADVWTPGAEAETKPIVSASDKTTGRLQLAGVYEVGDTGWRRVDDWFVNGHAPASAGLKVRRVGPTIYLVPDAWWNASGGTANQWLAVPTGWRPFPILNAGWLGQMSTTNPFSTGVPAVLTDIRVSGASGFLETLTRSSTVSGQLMWTTADAWPVTLPGEPAGLGEATILPVNGPHP